MMRLGADKFECMQKEIKLLHHLCDVSMEIHMSHSFFSPLSPNNQTFTPDAQDKISLCPNEYVCAALPSPPNAM
jgi:hypothetical protein